MAGNGVEIITNGAFNPSHIKKLICTESVGRALKPSMVHTIDHNVASCVAILFILFFKFHFRECALIRTRPNEISRRFS